MKAKKQTETVNEVVNKIYGASMMTLKNKRNQFKLTIFDDMITKETIDPETGLTVITNVPNIREDYERGRIEDFDLSRLLNNGIKPKTMSGFSLNNNTIENHANIKTLADSLEDIDLTNF